MLSSRARLVFVGAWCLASTLAMSAIRSEDAAALRTWSVVTAGGTQDLKASLKAISRGNAVFVDEAGQERTIALSDLSEADRKDALIQRVGSAVVVVHSKDVFDQPIGVGSGFVITGQGIILTNFHVIRGAGSVEVEFRDGQSKHVAECLAVDPLNDVAYLRVAEMPAGTHVVELSFKELPKQGDPVWTIGHPERLKNTVSWGDVNAVRKTTELSSELQQIIVAPAEAQWIQTDAVLAHGSSGGPLLNARGQAVGMNTFIAGPQLGFALHLSHARKAFEQTRSGQAVSLPIAPSAGESAMAWLSKEIAPVIKRFAEDNDRLKLAARGKSREELLQQLAGINQKCRQELLELARKDPASWPGFQSLYYLCSLASDGSPEGKQSLGEACDLLLKHHAQSQDLGGVAQKLAGLPDDSARTFCLRVMDSSPHKEVQAHAAIAVALGRIQWLALSGTLDLEALRKARQEADEMLQRLEKQHGDVVLGQATGKQWARELRAQLDSVRIGLPAQEIQGVDTEGKEFKLSEYKGKVVLLDFFADWCPWCRKMYPSERKLVEAMKARPFALLGVNTDNQRKLLDLVGDGTITWRTWADGENGPITAAWEVNGYPRIYLIDHEGQVRKLYDGAPSEEELAESIEKLVKAAEQVGTK